MKIVKFIKMQDNRYKILFLDNEPCFLYDDVIVKYELLRKKDIDEQLFEKIKNYNSRLEAYYKAIKYIEKKVRTKKEIKNYLSKLYDEKVVDETIDKLSQDGYLNDDAYIKAYINDQIALTNNGPDKITNNLVNLGFTKELVLFYMEKIDRNIFIDKIKKYVDKKNRLNHKYSENKLKEKLVYELVNLGYEKSEIYKIVNNLDIEVPNDLLNKEYKKIYDKLSKKYNGYDLEARIVNKLLVKGFNYDEIKSVLNASKSEIV